MVMFPGIAPLNLALLAALLAPTDAALGKPVVTNPTVPSVMREALNIESGLNDGICVPIVVLLLGLAVGTHIEHDTTIYAVTVVVEAGDRARRRPCCHFIDHSPAALCRAPGLDQYALGGSSGRGACGRLFRDSAGDRGKRLYCVLCRRIGRQQVTTRPQRDLARWCDRDRRSAGAADLGGVRGRNIAQIIPGSLGHR